MCKPALGPLLGPLCCLIVQLAFAQAIPQIKEVPSGLPQQERTVLLQKRSAVSQMRDALVSKLTPHNQKCASVAEGTSLWSECRAEQGPLEAEKDSYIREVKNFNNAVDGALINNVNERLRQINVPPPIPPEEASIRFGELAPGDKTSRRVVLGLEVGVAVLKVSAEVGGIACPPPYCKLILVVGKEVIAAEDAADVYLTKQDATYKRALGYLKDPSKRAQFTAIVRTLKEGKPLSEDASIDMVRTAGAILDPKLGNSGMRIAWDALWSPEAKNAMLTRAAIELAGETLGRGSSEIAKRLLLARDPVAEAAEEYLKTARRVREVSSDPDAGEAIGKAIRESDKIIAQSYRQASIKGEAVGEVVSIFSKWAAEEHVTKGRPE